MKEEHTHLKKRLVFEIPWTEIPAGHLFPEFSSKKKHYCVRTGPYVFVTYDCQSADIFTAPQPHNIKAHLEEVNKQNRQVCIDTICQNASHHETRKVMNITETFTNLPSNSIEDEKCN